MPGDGCADKNIRVKHQQPAAPGRLPASVHARCESAVGRMVDPCETGGLPAVWRNSAGRLVINHNDFDFAARKGRRGAKTIYKAGCFRPGLVIDDNNRDFGGGQWLHFLASPPRTVRVRFQPAPAGHFVEAIPPGCPASIRLLVKDPLRQKTMCRPTEGQP